VALIGLPDSTKRKLGAGYLTRPLIFSAMKKLPPGYTWRRATREDVDRIAELTAAVDVAQGADPSYRADEILIDWNRPGFEFDQDSWMFEYEGKLAAYGHLSPRGDSDLVLMAWTHPNHDQWALSFSLMSAMEPRAREIAGSSPYKRGVAIASEHEEALMAAIEAEGFKPDALFVEMVMSLDGFQLGDVRLPAGVEIRQLDPAETREFYDVLVAAFAEHWGAGFAPFDEWLRDVKGLEGYDPALSLVAVDAGRIVGALFSHVTEELGEIHDIGTLPDHRGRGLGEALMRYGFARLQEKGATSARLWVDKGNVTNAIRLYEKVGMSVSRKLHFYAKDL